MFAIFFRYGFQTSYGSPYEELLLSIATHLPQCVSVGEMVENPDIILLHGPFYYAVGTHLPYIIIGTHAAQALFPETCPFGPVVIQPVDIFICGMLVNPGLDGVPIAFACQHPQFEVLRHLQHPVPSHANLTAQARFTSIGRDKNFLFQSQQIKKIITALQPTANGRVWDSDE